MSPRKCLTNSIRASAVASEAPPVVASPVRRDGSVGGVTAAVARAKKGVLEAANEAEDHLTRMRAFRAEAKGDEKTQKAFQLMADYTDQFYNDNNFTMNVY